MIDIIELVAIPFESGHLSTKIILENTGLIELDFIGVAIPFESGHLSTMAKDNHITRPRRQVAIPFESGHLSTWFLTKHLSKILLKKSQSLLNQGIFQPNKRSKMIDKILKIMSQSLLNQGIFQPLTFETFINSIL